MAQLRNLAGRSTRLLKGAALVARSRKNGDPVRRELGARVSPALREFVEALPEERWSLLGFVAGAASELPEGTRVLDAGAGDAPYRELFGHCDYVTADWANSPHAGAQTSD